MTQVLLGDSINQSVMKTLKAERLQGWTVKTVKQLLYIGRMRWWGLIWRDGDGTPVNDV